VQCTPWQNGDQVSITIHLAGKYSETYDPYAYSARRKPRPPVVTLKDKEGNVLAKSAMSVGEAQSTYVWKPGTFKGPYDIAFELDLGPFEWSYKQVGQPQVK
jgi:hypothetical protein